MITNFSELYQKYAGDVYRFAYWLCGDARDAEDITSDTFLRALTAVDRIDTTTVKGYLLTIARNLAYKRSKQAQRFTALDPNLHAASPKPEQEADEQEALADAYFVKGWAYGELNKEGGFDLILSIGQVVPHEVVGMANYNKNIFVGTGGADGINKSHYLGAVYGMERMMGRADTPVRRVLNYASERFARNMPIVYVLTVVGKDEAGELVTRGLFVGDDVECFERAAALSLKVNFVMLEREIRKAVVFLDPAEFKSTWLGNKAVYRTRMAMADGGELLILAPGVKEFGEDHQIDKLIRKYGYRTTPEMNPALRRGGLISFFRKQRASPPAWQ